MKTKNNVVIIVVLFSILFIALTCRMSIHERNAVITPKQVLVKISNSDKSFLRSIRPKKQKDTFEQNLSILCSRKSSAVNFANKKIMNGKFYLIQVSDGQRYTYYAFKSSDTSEHKRVRPSIVEEMDVTKAQSFQFGTLFDSLK